LRGVLRATDGRRGPVPGRRRLDRLPAPAHPRPVNAATPGRSNRPGVCPGPYPRRPGLPAGGGPGSVGDRTPDPRVRTHNPEENPMTTQPGQPALRLLSLGAGVQSTTLLLLAAEGRLPGLDGAIFADTGWEPAAVYEQLDRIDREIAQPAGIPIYRVSAGNIRRDALDPAHRFASMPLFIKNPDGGDGMTRRQCTAEYKLKPIKAQVRQLLGCPHPKPIPRGTFAEQWIGISRDEFGRAKDSGIGYLKSWHPLL